jgi:hypothetical protein
MVKQIKVFFFETVFSFYKIKPLVALSITQQ